MEIYSCRPPNLSAEGFRDARSPKAEKSSSTLKEYGVSHFVKKNKRKKEAAHREDQH